MTAKLVRLKIFEPAVGNQDLARLDGHFNHPARYRYIIADNRHNGDKAICQAVGAEGGFTFVDGFCPRFWGEFPAIILKDKISESQRMDSDVFEPYEA